MGGWRMSKITEDFEPITGVEDTLGVAEENFEPLTGVAEAKQGKKPGLLDTFRAAGAGIVDAANSYLKTEAIFGMDAEKGTVEKGIDYLSKISDKIKPEKTDMPLYDYPMQAVQQTAQSITSALPTMVGKGSRAGRFTRGILGKGAVFGTAQYYDFMDEVRNGLTKEGLSKDEINEGMKAARGYAAASGAFESIGEIGSDLIAGKAFGITGTMKEGVKKGLLPILRRYGIAGASEIAGEELTTAGQYVTQEMARKALPKAGLQEQDLGSLMKDTAILTALQTVMTGGVIDLANARHRRSVENKVMKETGASREDVRKGLEDIASRDVQTEEASVPDEVENDISLLEQRAAEQAESEERIERGEAQWDLYEKTISPIKMRVKDAMKREGVTDVEFEPLVGYDISGLQISEEEKASLAEPSTPSEQLAEPSSLAVQEGEAGDVKQKVTFIGMQEMPDTEEYAGKAPMALVNDESGSTIVYKPEVMEIVNQQAYEDATQDMSTLVQEAGTPGNQVMIKNITTTGEGISQPKTRKDRIAKKKEVEGPTDAELIEIEGLLNDLDKEDISDVEIDDMLSEGESTSVSTFRQKMKHTKVEGIDDYADKVAAAEEGIVTENGFDKMNVEQLEATLSSILGQTDMKATEARDAAAQVDAILGQLYDKTGDNKHLVGYGNYEIQKEGRGKYSLQLATETLTGEMPVAETSITENSDPVLDNPMHRSLADATDYISRKKGEVSAADSEFPIFIAANISEAFANNGTGLDSIEKNIVGILDILEQKDSPLYSELVRGMTPSDLRQYNADMLAVSEYYEAVRDKLEQSGVTLMSDPLLVQTIITAVRKSRRSKTFAKWKDASKRTEGGPVVKDNTEQQADVSRWRSYIESAHRINDKDFPKKAREIITRLFMSRSDHAAWTADDAVYIHRVTGSLSEAERAWMMKAGNAVYALSRKAMEANVNAGMDTDTAVAFKDMYVDKAIRVIFRNHKNLEATYREIRKDFFEPMRERIRQHELQEAEQHHRRKFMDALRLYKKLAGKSDAILIAPLKFNITKSADLKAFATYVKGYYEKVEVLKSWGFEDYWPNYMTGSLLIKADGHVVTVAPDKETADKRIGEHYAKNPGVKEYTVEVKFPYESDQAIPVSRRQFFAVAGKFKKAGTEMPRGLVKIKPGGIFAGPLEKTKYILPGEDDIRKAMLIYSDAINKKLAFDPTVWQMQRYNGTFAPNVQKHINETFEVMREKYWESDKVIDEIFGRPGHRLFSKAVNTLRTGYVIAKLGYAPLKGFYNGVANFGMTAVQFREKTLWRGSKYMASKEGQAFLNSIKNYMGESAFAEGDVLGKGVRWKGHMIKGWKTALTPMGTFNIMELPGRKWNACVAHEFYIEQETSLGRKYSTEMEEEAKVFAIQSIDMLQGLATSTMMGKAFRSPAGRLFTLFKPFMVRNIEWMLHNAHSPTFWARWSAYMFMMTGLRGLIFMLASLPLYDLLFKKLGYGDVFTKAQMKLMEWADTSVKKGVVSGIGGMADRDVVAPMTWQLPKSTMDWLGVPGMMFQTLSGMYKVAGNANWSEEGKDLLKKEIAIARLVTETIEVNINADGWAYKDGRKQFNAVTEWDKKFFVPAGLKNVRQSYSEYLAKVTKDEANFRKDKADQVRGLFSAGVKDYMLRENVAIPERIVKRAQELITEHRLTKIDIMESIKAAQDSPAMRVLRQTVDSDRLKTYKGIEDAGKAMGYDFLTGKAIQQKE